MIRAVIGVPGAGKTYFALHCIERELVHSKRWVVTNLSEIKLPEFQAYLSKKYPLLGIDLSQRLQIIEKTQTRHWLRYRGHYTMPQFEMHAHELPEKLDQRLQEYLKGINDRDASGVVYFLDEAHRHFRADEWAKVAPVAIFYLAQHRHLNDTFWFMTQNPEQVFTTLRRSVQDCHVLRNHYVESFGIFKKPGCFYRRSFGYMPESKGKPDDHYDSGRMQLDKAGLGNCYRTRGALGGEVTVAEDKPPTKKLPFWTMGIFAAVAIAVLVGGLYLVPKVATHYMGKVMGMGVKSVGEAVGLKPKEGTEPANAVKSGPGKPSPRGEHASSEQNAPKWAQTGTRVVTGVAVAGRRFRVTLSNGNVITESDGTVRQIDATGVLLHTGERLGYVPSYRPPATANRAVPLQGDRAGEVAAVVLPPTGRETPAVAVPAAASEPRTDVPSVTNPPPPSRSEIGLNSFNSAERAVQARIQAHQPGGAPPGERRRPGS